jgi:hypothetical protein
MTPTIDGKCYWVIVGLLAGIMRESTAVTATAKGYARPFHGGNRGSNPLGDANISDFQSGFPSRDTLTAPVLDCVSVILLSAPHREDFYLLGQ